MFLLRLASTIAVLLALAASSPAQPDGFAADAKPGASQIQRWLVSGNPQTIAWGAYYARENADQAVLTRMLQLVARWTPPGDEDRNRRERMDAMSVVLDTLIQRREEVPAESISSIATSFPAQAMILASRLRIADATRLLLEWYDGGDGEDTERLARFAAMMLAKAPPPGFAASVLDQSRAELFISVRDEGGVGGGVGGGGCEDGVEAPPPKGWPPLFIYDVEENKNLTEDPVVIESGGDWITFNRRLAGSGRGFCPYFLPLTDETRHHLLREMLGVHAEKMQWKVQDYFSIDWENSDQYLKELRERLTSEEAQFHETAEALYAEKFLSKSEYESARPTLAVIVSDDRKSGGPLPKLEWRDRRTVITFASR